MHANNNLEIDGNVSDRRAERDLDRRYDRTTADWAAGDITSGGMPMIPVPDINADDYFSDADFILQSDGRITNRTETITYCNSTVPTRAGTRPGAAT